MSAESSIRKACDQIAAECIAVRIRLLNRVITSVYDDALRPLGLTINQLNLLVAITKMGSPTATQVGAFLQMDRSTLSRNLSRMHREGWLKFCAGEDARTQKLCITKKGEKLIRKALPSWQKAQRRANGLLGSKSLQAIGKLAEGIGSFP